MNLSECIKTDERCILRVDTNPPRRSLVAEKLVRWFIWSAAAILLITALGKITSAFGSARILEMQDPILSIKFRLLLPLVGVLELVIAAPCFSKRFSTDTKLIFIAWIAMVFVIYRAGLWLVGWHHPCSCMGSLAGMLHLTDQNADLVMKVALAYLTIGSCAALGVSRLFTLR